MTCPRPDGVEAGGEGRAVWQLQLFAIHTLLLTRWMEPLQTWPVRGLGGRGFCAHECRRQEETQHTHLGTFCKEKGGWAVLP